MSKAKQQTAWRNRIVGEGAQPADQFLAHPLNARRHPASQREALRGVLSEVGWVQRVIVNKTTGRVLDGHARIEEALSRGDSEPVPYVEVELSESEEKLVLAAFDPISALATVDKEVLDSLLQDVSTGNSAVQKMLSELAEANGLYFGEERKQEAPEAEIDRAAELQEKWQTETGQLWEIGAHRLLVGDSTEKADVERLCGSNRAILMVTDPPYGVQYDPNWRNEAADAGHISYGATNVGEVANDGRIDWTDAYRNFDAQVAYVWHAGRHATEVASNLNAAGFEIISQVIWAKTTFAISRGDYHWQHEPCWYANKKGKAHNWQGARDQSTLWKIDRGCKEKTGHGTEKPIECMSRPIQNNSKQGDLICDPFLGSGTTMVAAQQTNRICYGMEIEPKYVAVCLERLSQMGLTPKKTDG